MNAPEAHTHKDTWAGLHGYPTHEVRTLLLNTHTHTQRRAAQQKKVRCGLTPRGGAALSGERRLAPYV